MSRFLLPKTALFAWAIVGASFAAHAQSAPSADAWQIGPIIKGRNHSVGMPYTPEQAPLRQKQKQRGQQLWSFDFPYPSVDAGHVHYVTFKNGSLAGKRKILMRYRIDAAKGTRFVPRENPNMPGTVRLYFQRQGDKWTGRGRYQWYRWYAPAATVRQLAPGVYSMEANLDVAGWVPVSGGARNARADAFNDALNYADRVGFVFGSHTAAGHGVYSTDTARFTLLNFDII